MTTCTKSIQTQLTNNTTELLPFVVNNTVVSISFVSFGNTLIRLSMTQNDTLRFNINLSSTGIVNFQVSFYKINLTTQTYSSVGSVTSPDASVSFIKDFVQGEYIICFYSLNSSSYNGAITTIFSNFKTYAALRFTGYTGNSASFTSDFIIKQLPCNKPLLYEIIDGALPEGIQMTGSGTLYGTLPNLDCMLSNINLSPSSNWYTQMPTGLAFPYGRQWRFKVKTTILGYPDTIFAEQWMSIRVYNNFDLEKNNFLVQMPFQTSYTITINPNQNDIVLPTTLCPNNNCDNTTINQNITATNLTPSPAPFTDVELFKLPDTMINFPTDLNITTFKSWYLENVKDSFKTYLNENQDLYNQNFIEQVNNSVLLKLILIKNGAIENVNNDFDYSLMNYIFQKVSIDNITFLEITTSIMQMDVFGIPRNAYDLDVQYLQNKLTVNATLELTFVAFTGTTCLLI